MDRAYPAKSRETIKQKAKKMKIAPLVGLTAAMAAPVILFLPPVTMADVGSGSYSDDVKAYGDTFHNYVCDTVRMADYAGEIEILFYNIRRDGLFSNEDTAKVIWYAVYAYCPWQASHLSAIVNKAVQTPTTPGPTVSQQHVV